MIMDGSVMEFGGTKVRTTTRQEYIPFEQSVLDTVRSLSSLVVMRAA